MRKRAVVLCALLVIGILSACGETNTSDIGTEYNQERQDNQTAHNENLPTETKEDDLTNSVEGSIEKQIEIFAQERSKWAIDVDYANEKYCFTLADLDMDKRIELIVSNFGGTGCYTYSHFYKIGDDGTMKELETTFTEGDSQPDIMDDVSNEMDMTAFFYSSKDGKGRNDFIVYDRLKDAPDSYHYRVSSLSIIEDVVTETKLANQRVTYEGEDYSEHTISQDYSCKKLTEEEYVNYPTTYYEALNAVKRTVHFQWRNVKDISEMSDSDVIEILTESYEKYSYR